MKKLVFAMATALFALGACTTQGTEENKDAATVDNGQAAIENIMTRTSIRQYKDQPVEQEKIDIMLKAGVSTSRFSLIGKFTVPVSLTKGENRLVYNTVITKSGNTASISADTMDIQMEILLGKFKFSAGVIYNGFSGRVADILKSLVKREGRREALVAMLDPEVSTYYALATFGFNAGPVLVESFVRADLMRINGTLTIPVSAGIGITF